MLSRLQGLFQRHDAPLLQAQFLPQLGARQHVTVELVAVAVAAAARGSTAHGLRQPPNCGRRRA